MTAQIDLRPVRDADAEDMAEVQNAIHRAGLSIYGTTIEEIRETYLDPEHRIACTVAVRDGRVVGFQSLKRAWPGNFYGVTVGWGVIGTHIRPDAHRLGVGRRLWDVTLAAARGAGLPTIDATIGSDNAGGLAYYRAMGFAPYEELDAAIRHRYDL